MSVFLEQRNSDARNHRWVSHRKSFFTFSNKKKKIELFLSALKIKGEKRGVLLVK